MTVPSSGFILLCETGFEGHGHPGRDRKNTCFRRSQEALNRHLKSAPPFDVAQNSRRTFHLPIKSLSSRARTAHFFCPYRGVHVPAKVIFTENYEFLAPGLSSPFQGELPPL